MKFTSGLATELELHFVGKIEADFCPVIYLCLYRADQNLTLSVASLHQYHRITSLIQSSREELDSEVSDSDL